MSLERSCYLLIAKIRKHTVSDRDRDDLSIFQPISRVGRSIVNIPNKKIIIIIIIIIIQENKKRKSFPMFEQPRWLLKTFFIRYNGDQ